MRTSAKLISAVATVALIAGVSVAAMPAQATTRSTVDGATSLTILPSVHTDFGVAGVQLQALEPAVSDNDLGTQRLTFPVARRVKEGVLLHRGIMTIAAALNRIDLSAPRLEFAPAPGTTTGRIVFQDLYSAVGGGRKVIFTVSNMSVTTTRGRVTQSGQAWKRTDHQHITGDVSLVNNPAFVKALNDFVGTTALTPGMAFGTLDTSVTTTVTCTTRRECR